MFGIVVAVLSRLLALLIGLVAGYAGGWVDRLLMSINDTFIVIPLFPILVLFYFVLQDHMSWGLLALMMACLGWSYDARLIRSVALSLRHPRVHRDRHLLRHEHARRSWSRSICPTCCRSCSRPP